MTRGGCARRRELSDGRVAARSPGARAARCDARDLLRTAQRVGLDVAELTKLLRDLKACAADLGLFRRRAPRAPPRIHRSTRRLSRWGTAETRHRSKHTEGHKPSTPSSEASPRALRQRVPALRARSPRVRAHGEGPRARVCPPHGSGHRVQSCVSGPFGALEQNGAHSGRVPTPGRRCAARPATTTGAAARRGLRWRRRRLAPTRADDDHPRFSTRFTFLANSRRPALESVAGRQRVASRRARGRRRRRGRCSCGRSRAKAA